MTQQAEPPLPVTLRFISEEIPECLKAQPWVVWRWERKSNGEWTKPPYFPGEGHPLRLRPDLWGTPDYGQPRCGPTCRQTLHHAASDDPGTWTDFAAADARIDGRTIHGAGMITSPPFLVFDFDACVDPQTGEIDPWAREWAERLGSYAEHSVTISGLHVVVKAHAPWPDDACYKKIKIPGVRHWGAKDGAAVEVITRGRYLAMTGWVPSGFSREVRENQAAVDALWAWLVAQQPQRPEPKGKPGIGIPAGDTPQMDDGEIIERARDAANRAKFMALFDGGDTSAYGGDDSAADLALCELLVFWTQDEAQIDRIFRRSALMREKWDEKHYSDGSSYGAGTIRKALEMSAGGERYTREPPRAQGTAAGAVLTPTVTIRQVAPEAGPVLREDALYGLAGRLVRAILPHTEADAANLLINLLVMFGNAAGGTYHTYADGFRHGLNLFATVVGPTNAAKGTGTQRAFDVLRRVDEVWAKTRKQAGLSSGEGVIAAVQDQEDGPTDKRLFLYESEFGSTLKIMGREGNSLSGILRQAWDSGDLCTLTKVPVRAGDAHISIIAHITPAELKKRLSETDAANGFANRFLWVCVDRSKRLPGGTGEPSVAPLIAELHKALQFARHHSQTVRRTPQAEDLWGSTTSA